ncbi:MAG TPA: TNT domain-containing protein [Amycolatopsis sp.]|nr:TNT domain-containing protein [Amycolatopsis sp.]
MGKSRRIWVVLAAWLMVVIGAGTTVAQAAAVPDPVPRASSADHAPLPWPPPPSCPATGIAGSQTDQPPVQLEPYYRGDWRLGPAVLPRVGPVAALLRGYHRTDALTPKQFIACYWDPTAAGNQGGWRYPPNGGFQGDPVAVVLQAGQYLDRFGPNTGRFLAPYGGDYAERALPPSNLDTFEVRYPNNYHVFRILKTFTADGGPAAPWFGQPGEGLQYRLDDKYFPGEVVPPEHANTQWLIDHQYLAPVN